MAEHRVAIGRAGKGFGFWALQASSWLFVLYLVYAQCLPAFDYELGVRLGTQEPASQVMQVGVAYWWAFAFGDLVAYLPLFIVGLIGHLRNRNWGRIILSTALGITAYWPIVSLAAVHAARKAGT